LTLEIGNEIWNAYEAIHELGVIHGDVAPRNILVDSKAGGVWIIDFEYSSFIDEGDEKSHWNEKQEVWRMMHDIKTRRCDGTLGFA